VKSPRMMANLAMLTAMSSSAWRSVLRMFWSTISARVIMWMFRVDRSSYLQPRIVTGVCGDLCRPTEYYCKPATIVSRRTASITEECTNVSRNNIALQTWRQWEYSSSAICGFCSLAKSIRCIWAILIACPANSLDLDIQ
jgi:hypothetical protein